VPEDLIGFDSYLCMTAPFYGQVKTINEPLGKFRIHGANSWSQLSWQPERLLVYVDQEVRRAAFVRQWAEKLGFIVNPNALSVDYHHVMNRVACKRVFPYTYPFPNEPVGTLIKTGIRAVLADPFVNRTSKLIIAIWFLVVGLSPQHVALWAIKTRDVPLGRPRIVQLVLSLIGAVRTR
jgi:hypothetical protein